MDQSIPAAPQGTIAVFIDYENLALGTGKRNRRGHQELGPAPDVKRILERLVEKGRIVVKRAYCDWQRFDEAVTPLHELGIELIEIPDRAYTGKNSADIRLAVDAMEMCLTKNHIDTFAVLSGDSDFSPLVSKLREFNKTVIGVGMREATSTLLTEACDEFIFYEDIVSAGGVPAYEDRVPKEKLACYKLMLETVDALQRETDSIIRASLIKDTMRRKQPQFSERSYGYRSFTALLREAASFGLIEIHTDPRSGTAVVDGFCE
ncbi:MAG: NYN domain-containing protein [Parolsenella sp.]|uniref:NYN domain-containing protein n=1 Tax=unclassified Parolsenella TaxID=2623992 RepID=UPI002A75E829|nr:NYN domain-containing protein [Parolsenella sp.]MCI5950472.1 NYN domain-containing protein [Coriobacteriaceae bacterium]MDY3291603.1 NYN domain-containing protein [Parolsenella sp.]